MRLRLSNLVLLVIVAGCSDKGGQQNPVVGGDGAGATTAAGANGSAGTSAAGTNTATAGTSGAAGTPTGASGMSAAGSGTSTPAAGANAPAGSGGAVAGSSGVAATGGAGAAGGAGDAAAAGMGAAGMAAPSGPVDLAMMGPYEVVRDQPVGEGFEYTIASTDTGDGSGCASFAMGFGGDAQQAMDFVKIPPDLKMNMYSLYRPAKLEEGKKYPIITWGNGTCALPESYGVLLKHWASHGFFVIAANSRQVGSNGVMTKALDWAFAANMDPKSPYYQKIDTERVGASGHSQGGGATVTAARDSRVKSVVIWNGGSTAVKPFFAVSGDRDIVGMSISGMKSAVMRADKAAWIWYHMVPQRGSGDGHLTLITEPERVVGPSTAFFKAVLLDDADAKTWFNGASCKLCGMESMFEFGAKGI